MRVIDEDDASLVREYQGQLKAERGIGISRANKVGFHLIGWGRFIGPFRTNTLSDIHLGIEQLRDFRLKGGCPYKQNTIRDYIEVLKAFYRWMTETGYSSIPRAKIDRIRAPATDRMTRTAAEMLTPQEIKTMIDACQTSRARALIAMLYDGGFRLKELATAVWGDVKFDEIGAVVNTNLKTEWLRHIRLVPSAQYLSQWRNDFHGDPTGETLVFCTRVRLWGQKTTMADVVTRALTGEIARDFGAAMDRLIAERDEVAGREARARRAMIIGVKLDFEYLVAADRIKWEKRCGCLRSGGDRRRKPTPSARSESCAAARTGRTSGPSGPTGKSSIASAQRRPCGSHRSAQRKRCGARRRKSAVTPRSRLRGSAPGRPRGRRYARPRGSGGYPPRSSRGSGRSPLAGPTRLWRPRPVRNASASRIGAPGSRLEGPVARSRAADEEDAVLNFVTSPANRPARLAMARPARHEHYPVRPPEFIRRRR